MEAVGNHYLTPQLLEEVRAAKREENWKKIGLVALGTLLCAGFAGGLAASVWGFKHNSIFEPTPKNFNVILGGGWATCIICFLAFPCAFIVAPHVKTLKKKIREMVKREDLTDLQRFELYRRNQHRFSPKEFYDEALRKVIKGEWKILETPENQAGDVLAKFKASLNEFLTNPYEVEANSVLEDILPSSFLKDHAQLEWETAIQTFGPQTTSVNTPIPFKYLMCFPKLSVWIVAPNPISQLNQLTRHQKPLIEVSLADCRDFDFDSMDANRQITYLSIYDIPDLENALELILKCPALQELRVEIPKDATLDQLQKFQKALPASIPAVTFRCAGVNKELHNFLFRPQYLP